MVLIIPKKFSILERILFNFNIFNVYILLQIFKIRDLIINKFSFKKNLIFLFFAKKNF